MNPRTGYPVTRFRVLRIGVQSCLPVSAPCSTSPPAAFAEPSRTTTNETKTETTTVAVGSIRTHVLGICLAAVVPQPLGPVANGFPSQGCRSRCLAVTSPAGRLVPLTAPANPEFRALTAEFIELHTVPPRTLHLSGYPELMFYDWQTPPGARRRYLTGAVGVEPPQEFG